MSEDVTSGDVAPESEPVLENDAVIEEPTDGKETPSEEETLPPVSQEAVRNVDVGADDCSG